MISCVPRKTSVVTMGFIKCDAFCCCWQSLIMKPARFPKSLLRLWLWQQPVDNPVICKGKDRKDKEWSAATLSNSLVGPQEPLLATGEKWKQARIRHVTHYNSLSKTILQGTWPKPSSRAPGQNHPPGHLAKTILQGTWPKPSSRAPRRVGDAVVGRGKTQMMDGQHQRVDIPVHALTAHSGLLQ